MNNIESEGKTVALAVETALKTAGLRRDQVEVEILNEGAKGFMGFGSKPARVRLTEKHWGDHGKSTPAPKPPAAPRRSESGRRSQQKSSRAPRSADAHRPDPRPDQRTESPRRGDRVISPEKTEAARTEGEKFIVELMRLMQVSDAKVTVLWDDTQDRLRATIDTTEAERLIGQGGKTLESLQLLVNLMIMRRIGEAVPLQVDTGGYWKNREDAILTEAQKGIETVKSTGRPCRLQPMLPQMRRLVHRSLADHPDVVTSSEGEGSWRKVVLRLRK